MYTTASLLALASSASATILGFNYGSTFTTGAAKVESDFEAEFTTAANLVGTSGDFTSARLYTMVQGGTASDPISAIPAAIKTNTTLLLGLWASGGDTSFSNEILALKAAIQQYGDSFTSIVDGISVGSEDLYRNSPQGIEAGSYVGANPDTLARYIKDTKDAIAGTGLEGSPIGHVDTWTAWVNGSNQAVIDACDWVGMDAYPYFQDTMSNDIGKSKSLFQEALEKTQGASGGKSVWITETGHPVSGKTVGQSVASVENAETYWKTVGCPLFSQMNVWWYTLQDAAPDTPSPSFGVVGSTLSTTPLYDLSCKNVNNQSSSSAASPSATSISASSSVSAGAGPSTTGTASGSNSTSGGSPGGVPSSQVSIQETATVIPSPASSNATGSTYGSGTGSSGSGAGAGAGSGANGTFTAPSASATATIPVGDAMELRSGGLGAAFIAIMVAIFAL